MCVALTDCDGDGDAYNGDAGHACRGATTAPPGGGECVLATPTESWPSPLLLYEASESSPFCERMHVSYCDGEHVAATHKNSDSNHATNGDSLGAPAHRTDAAVSGDACNDTREDGGGGGGKDAGASVLHLAACTPPPRDGSIHADDGREDAEAAKERHEGNAEKESDDDDDDGGDNDNDNDEAIQVWLVQGCIADWEPLSDAEDDAHTDDDCACDDAVADKRKQQKETCRRHGGNVVDDDDDDDEEEEEDEDEEEEDIRQEGDGAREHGHMRVVPKHGRRGRHSEYWDEILGAWLFEDDALECAALWLCEVARLPPTLPVTSADTRAKRKRLQKCARDLDRLHARLVSTDGRLSASDKFALAKKVTERVWHRRAREDGYSAYGVQAQVCHRTVWPRRMPHDPPALHACYGDPDMSSDDASGQDDGGDDEEDAADDVRTHQRPRDAVASHTKNGDNRDPSIVRQREQAVCGHASGAGQPLPVAEASFGSSRRDDGGTPEETLARGAVPDEQAASIPSQHKQHYAKRADRFGGVRGLVDGLVPCDDHRKITHDYKHTENRPHHGEHNNKNEHDGGEDNEGGDEEGEGEGDGDGEDGADDDNDDDDDDDDDGEDEDGAQEHATLYNDA